MIEIFHVSDLHLGQSSGQNQKAKDLLKKISQQFPFTKDSNRYLLVTGDITDGGKTAQYKLAKDALWAFKGHVFVTPGNHDYGRRGWEYSEASAKYFDDPFAESIEFPHPFFDKKVFRRQLKDGSDSSPFLIIGLNSCSKEGLEDFAEGEVGKEQREQLRRILEKCDPQIPKLLFLHHVPNKKIYFPPKMTLRDWRELMEIVKDRIDMLAFGHQGLKLQVESENKLTLVAAERRPMKPRTLYLGKKKAKVLDADNSVDECACYQITLQDGQPDVKVVHL
jgi:DNA repair exonuclease SbcCD nuclease subunit